MENESDAPGLPGSTPPEPVKPAASAPLEAAGTPKSGEERRKTLEGAIEAIRLANRPPGWRSEDGLDAETLVGELKKALAKPLPPTEPVAAYLVETVTGDFGELPGVPFWRVEIDGYCADFDHESAAINFAAAINRQSGARPPTDDVRARALEVLVGKGWELHRRALSYATGIPAVNMLLAECGEFAKVAAETLSAQYPLPADDEAAGIERQAIIDGLEEVRAAFDDEDSDHANLTAAIEFIRARPVQPPLPIMGEGLAPIDMILFCPHCGLKHVDEPDERTPDWTNPPHRSHLCHRCGCIWRPADVPTNGVSALATAGKADTISLSELPALAPEGVVMVPREPTDEMIDAGCEALDIILLGEEARQVFAAMIATAPASALRIEGENKSDVTAGGGC